MGSQNFYRIQNTLSSIVLVCDILCCTVMGAMGNHTFYKTT